MNMVKRKTLCIARKTAVPRKRVKGSALHCPKNSCTKEKGKRKRSALPEKQLYEGKG
jgi:hypothetical protein